MAMNTTVDKDLAYDTQAWIDSKAAMEYCGLVVGSDAVGTYGEKIKTLKPIIDKVPELEGQVNELENTISENDADFNNIYEAIVLVGGEPVKEDRDSYAVAISGLSKGGTEFSNMAYFFYKNYRDVKTYWSLVTGTVTCMLHMLDSAVMPIGEYVLDITGIASEANLECLITCLTVAEAGEALIKLKVGRSNTSLKKLIYDDNTGGLNNDNGKRLSVIITDDSDCSGITTLNNSFRNHPFFTINLSKMSVAKLKDLNSAFRCITVNTLVLPLDTSEVSDFSYCFANLNYGGYGTLETLDLSTWDFKEGAVLTEFIASARKHKSILFKEGTVLKNSNTNRAFYNNLAVTEINNLVIKDDNNMTLTNAHRDTFARCEALVNINSDEVWELNSNMDSMFGDCVALVKMPSIILTNMGDYRNSINSMCSNCKSIENIDITIVSNGNQLYADFAFNGCSKLKIITGNLDLSYGRSINNMFAGCYVLEYFETTGSLGGNYPYAQTYDFSASNVFNIAKQLELLAPNESGVTKTIKLHSSIYNTLTDDVRALAAEKNYTLAS